MKLSKQILLSCFVLGCLHNPLAVADTTIVIVRHGEKPALGLGQLSCKGLNRSLALVSVILNKYGRPLVIYAPNPAVKKLDKGVSYAYIRPLATIEPLAIRVGLPVNIDWGMTDISQLTDNLLARTEGTQVVVWEHHFAVKLATNLLTVLGEDAQQVPGWNDNDFDSIFVVRITGRDKDRHVTFTRESEDLNEISDSCT
jgi:hypothetical protein